MKADVTNEEDIKRVIDTAIEKFGRLDCLFNNAGGAVRAASVAEFTKEVSQAVFDLNFNSMALATKYAIPHMLATNRPCSIINNSSIAASKAGFGSALYSASKAAMNAYTRTAAMELAPRGIRVSIMEYIYIVYCVTLKEVFYHMRLGQLCVSRSNSHTDILGRYSFDITFKFEPSSFCKWN